MFGVTLVLSNEQIRLASLLSLGHNEKDITGKGKEGPEGEESVGQDVYHIEGWCIKLFLCILTQHGGRFTCVSYLS